MGLNHNLLRNVAKGKMLLTPLRPGCNLSYWSQIPDIH